MYITAYNVMYYIREKLYFILSQNILPKRQNTKHNSIKYNIVLCLSRDNSEIHRQT